MTKEGILEFQTIDFDYELPHNLIAQVPALKRDESKMMTLNRFNGEIQHLKFYQIIDLLNENDVLVLNNTKVIGARIFGTKKSTGAKIEIFLLKKYKKENNIWECLIKPSKRVKVGNNIEISPDFNIIVLEKCEHDGKWIVKLNYKNNNIEEAIKLYGNMPLPPYIERKMTTNEIKNLDKERYQTVYAKNSGSVAAPTAGLHFSKEVLEKLSQKNIQICYITLNVGLGTFRPVKTNNILEHKMDYESYFIDEDTAKILNQAIETKKNIVACGTTTVRTLESVYAKHNKIVAGDGETNLFIYPGYKFKIVNKLITNFHLPKSTLLMLVSAFSKREYILNAYKIAINENYRFYSYGDCMFLY